MFDAPLDAWVVWLGVATASGAALTVAAGLPAAPPPDAEGVARTIDRTAAGPHDGVAERPLHAADAVRVGARSLSLRGDGGHAHADVRYGPVTPAVHDDRLRRVLRGERPGDVFETPSAFEETAATARAADPVWQRTDRITVRAVTWEGVRVVLVG